jgi:hypothetical protein
MTQLGQRQLSQVWHLATALASLFLQLVHEDWKQGADSIKSDLACIYKYLLALLMKNNSHKI